MTVFPSTGCVIAALAIVAGVAPVSVSAQSRDRTRVFFDAVSFAGDGAETERLDLFVAVPYALLPLVRTDAGFVANYRVRTEVYAGSRRVHDTTFERTATTRSNDPSAQGTSADFLQQRIALVPGTYEARIEIIDPTSSFVASARRTVTIVDHDRHRFSLSGALLIEKIREDANGFVMTPRVSDEIPADANAGFLFFEAYNDALPVDVRLEARFRAADGTTSEPRVTELAIPSGRSQQWVRLDAEGVVTGEQIIELRALRRDDPTTLLASAERSVRVLGAGVAVTDAELDERIAQLRHVAAASEIEKIRSAASVRERREQYMEFWRRIDPSPGTPENEAMTEYLARVEYANDHYRSTSEGWQTDMGRIYIIYGPPDNVLRDPFATEGRRTETWQYFSRGNLHLVFEDDSGFGDYRLLTPISSLEKYRYRE